MRIVECLAPFVGDWQGVNRLRLMPTEEYRESDAGATVSVTAGEFVTVAYTWSEGGKPQNGLMLLGGKAAPAGEAPNPEEAAGPGEAADGPGEATVVWVDSWHTGPTWMTLSGPVGEDGVVRLTGYYPAPTGPDWGWQIHIDPGHGDGGVITMHNMVPGEPVYQVVEIVCDRRRSGSAA
ncbi:hypothetical protein Lfu02_33840 [Longispora fulva]|uniref:DUF1579 domain-containing protein n=1 Tax=Longispora fulva TaxID=619741 RepID=A0A8J7GR37_9ACTN|nr:hypothetical protein [Longispora fulva]MBG6141833.1 hypothetical protein [Longispora fulva]GIG59012.1 hypothetical protein Lfu02_33840 [Longispora fulva]